MRSQSHPVSQTLRGFGRLRDGLTERPLASNQPRAADKSSWRSKAGITASAIRHLHDLPRTDVELGVIAKTTKRPLPHPIRLRYATSRSTTLAEVKLKIWQRNSTPGPPPTWGRCAPRVPGHRAGSYC